MSSWLLRLLRNHPILLATWIAVGCVFAALGEVALSVSRDIRIDRRVHSIVVRLAAEEAAFFAARHGIGASRSLEYRTASGFSCRLSTHLGGHGRRLRVEVGGGPTAEATFECELLDGAGPEPIGGALSMAAADLPAQLVAAPEPVLLGASVFPRLDQRLMRTRVESATAADGFRVDDSIALLRLPHGTDLADHVLAADAGGAVTLRVPASGVVRVDGHLWLDRGQRPLRVRLDRNLTVVVRGNIYLGRSLELHGPGHLILVASHREGDLEESGAAFLGLPGSDASGQRLSIDASLVLEGDLHVLARRSNLRGAVVIGGRCLSAPGKRVLRVTGELAPDVQRERIAGFVVSGGARPGRLSILRP